MRKKTTPFLAILSVWSLSALSVHAQIRIGPPGGTFSGSASLDVQSGPYTTGSPYRGLLLPVVTTTQRGQIQNPATGLLVFNATTNQVEVNTGTAAAPVWTPGGVVNAGGGGSGWSLTGNAGTNSTTNFLGTTDNTPFAIRVNNQPSGRIDPALFNVAFGYLTFTATPTGQGNTALGTSALYTLSSGSFNTGAGYKALFSNTSGIGNTAVGAVALQGNTGGNNNTAMGQVALTGNTTGSNNTALGAGSLQTNSTGYENTAVGSNAQAKTTTGYSNIAVGTDALYNNTNGHDNTAFGGSALLNNTSGQSNMATGNLSMRLNTTGQANTAAGTLALQYNTGGNFNTALGYNAGPPSGSPTLTNATAIGANAIVNASNTIVLGDNTITAIRANVQTISTLSDQRIKEQITANVPGLSFITRLRPVTYYVNKQKEAQLTGHPVKAGVQDPVLHSGFLAQEVEAAAKAAGYNFEGVKQEEGGKYYTVGYTLFVVPLVQAVKDLHAEVIGLKARLDASQTSYQQLAEQVRRLEVLLEAGKPAARQPVSATR